MKIAGIVAEYNPFHNGHRYQIEQTLENHCSHIVAVMSGNFTQRGEPAILPKWDRCRAALSGGVDLVIELPVAWAVSSAQNFAAGAVRLLDSLGCVDVLSFGSESGDLSLLRQEADLLRKIDACAHRPEPILQNYLKSGLSYPRSMELAARELSLGTLSPGENPNDILAREYLSSLERIHSSIQPLAIQRMGAGHDSPDPQSEFSSASFIRSLVSDGNLSDSLRYLPPSTHSVLLEALSKGKAPANKEIYGRLVLSQLRRMDRQAAAALPDVSEGLENRILSAASKATDLESLYSLIKSKRYTHARIRRIILSAFLGIPDEMAGCPVPYIRVLGFSRKGLDILKNAKQNAKLPVVSRHSDFLRLDAFSREVYSLECRSSDLYSLCLPVPFEGGLEQRFTPIRL